MKKSGVLIFILSALVLSSAVFVYAAAQKNPGHMWGEMDCDGNFCVDTSKSLVGIGKITPVATLDAYSTFSIGDTNGAKGIAISSDGWTSIALDSTKSTRTAIIHYGGDSSNDLRFGRYKDNFGGWEANVVTFSMNADPGSIVLDYNSRVGIGTPTPTAKFEVAQSSSGIGSGLRFSNGGHVWDVWKNGAGDLVLMYDAIKAVTIRTDGGIIADGNICDNNGCIGQGGGGGGDSYWTADGNTISNTNPGNVLLTHDLDMQAKDILGVRTIKAHETDNLDIAYQQDNNVVIKGGSSSGVIRLGGPEVDIDGVVKSGNYIQATAFKDSFDPDNYFVAPSGNSNLKSLDVRNDLSVENNLILRTWTGYTLAGIDLFVWDNGGCDGQTVVVKVGSDRWLCAKRYS